MLPREKQITSTTLDMLAADPYPKFSQEPPVGQGKVAIGKAWYVGCKTHLCRSSPGVSSYQLELCAFPCSPKYSIAVKHQLLNCLHFHRDIMTTRGIPQDALRCRILLRISRLPTPPHRRYTYRCTQGTTEDIMKDRGEIQAIRIYLSGFYLVETLFMFVLYRL